MSSSSVVVIGASLAGLSAVRALREQGHRGPITVVGDELHPPYDRPPLSKEFLHDDIDISLGGEDDEADADTTWLLGRRAIEISTDFGGHVVILEDGTRLAAESVVIATGARARTLPSAHALDGIHTLRTVDDARALRTSLRSARSLVVVGAGFIGAEVASSAAAHGLSVTVIEISSAPLESILGPHIGSLCAGLHAANGVRLLTGVAVDRFVGDKRVGAVQLTDGTVVPADVVVVGIGAVPNTEWANGSQLHIDNGFVTDPLCRTSVPGIYAIGDCARSYDESAGSHHRSEHWTNATAQARIAAAAIVGATHKAAGAPYFWSRQYGRMLQFAGRCSPTDEVRFVEGDPSTATFTAVYERAGEPVAVFAIDSPRVFTRYRKQIERRPVAAPLT
ncbi:NAD(P)/FAD-dependent oxidoreductase [Antrihabitans sp. YC2-6]|uniref:NAD(P)/FAD-dependent oxidoreductase n=1 Tax=Antrihabitans sp. YC2-6 TaxID=2799498 RepID=UPI0018F79FAB|nr:FAD-dependent oxidoreductase [Antrihabitans sp. YC2-6]MBJ8346689.1 FAD-dependent oxidoreductase [Antrihabitans sp. YC2-6]